MGKCPDAKEEINHAAIIIGGLNNKWNSSCNNISKVIWVVTFNSVEHMNHWLKKCLNEWQDHFEWYVPRLSKW